MADKENLVRRTQLQRSEYRVLGKKVVDDLFFFVKDYTTDMLPPRFRIRKTPPMQKKVRRANHAKRIAIWITTTRRFSTIMTFTSNCFVSWLKRVWWIPTIRLHRACAGPHGKPLNPRKRSALWIDEPARVVSYGKLLVSPMLKQAVAHVKLSKIRCSWKASKLHGTHSFWHLARWNDRRTLLFFAWSKEDDPWRGSCIKSLDYITLAFLFIR